MPCIMCLCGKRIDLSTIPNPNGYLLRSEEEEEKIVDRIVQLHAHPDEVDDFEIAVYIAITPRKSPAPYVLQCTACGRLAFFDRPSCLGRPLWFLPENCEGPPRLLASLAVGSQNAGSQKDAIPKPEH
jgi:hypothetical protein